MIKVSRIGRRTTTSQNKVFLTVLCVGLLVIWTAPVWVRLMFPGFLVWSVEPWQLHEADLGMRRVVSNLVVKPGLRTLMSLAFVVTMIGVKWLIIKPLNSSKKDWRVKWPSLKNLGSTEFVVEGRRASLLVEFAREVEAV